jgi:hypothetical protein
MQVQNCSPSRPGNIVIAISVVINNCGMLPAFEGQMESEYAGHILFGF